MNLTITVLERQADIHKDDVRIASLMLDAWEQVQKIILLPDIIDEETEHIIRLAGSHIRHFVRHRNAPSFGGLMTTEYRDASLTGEISHMMLTTQQIADDAQAMSIDEIKEMCMELRIPIITAVYRNVEEALAGILADPRLEGKLTIDTTEVDFLGEMGVAVRTEEESGFRFWHSVSMGGFELDIVPLYHPARQSGRASVSLVNGDTDANISGKSVRDIYSPEAARRAVNNGFSTWGSMNHPYFAAGPSFGMKIIPEEVLSEEGAASLLNILLGALELDGKYIAISGGFRAPAGTPAIPFSGKRRGSEERCYWERQVLLEEGELASAHVPSWIRR